MSKFSLNNPPFLIEYGNDPVAGVFLAVTDLRRDDDHRISQFHTGPVGEGKKISNATMSAYLARHVVPESQIINLFDKLRSLAPQGQLREDFKCYVCICDTFDRCDKCHSEFYCSKECQLEDFLRHKVKCDELTIPPVVAELTNRENRTSQTPREALCSSCNSPTIKTCAKCHSSFFCSRECQLSDWPVHKFICDELPFPRKSVPATNEFYGVYLHTEKNAKPVMVKIEIENGIETNEETGEEVSFSRPDLKPFLGDVSIGTNHIALPEFVLEVRFRDNYYMDGSKRNELVDKLAKSKNPIDWHGPVVIVKYKGTRNKDLPAPVYCDFELKDLKHVASFFESFGREMTPETREE